MLAQTMVLFDTARSLACRIGLMLAVLAAPVAAWPEEHCLHILQQAETYRSEHLSQPTSDLGAQIAQAAELMIKGLKEQNPSDNASNQAFQTEAASLCAQGGEIQESARLALIKKTKELSDCRSTNRCGGRESRLVDVIAKLTTAEKVMGQSAHFLCLARDYLSCVQK